MTIMGELGCVDVPGVLQLLGSRNNTGLLWITADGEEVGLYLTGGALAQVTSSRLPLRLGRILVQRGLITSSQLHQALRDQDQGDERISLGQLLLRRGWVSQEGLNSCIEEQCISVVARAIRAERGTFLFQPGVQPPVGSMTARLDPNHVLMEATRRVDELADLRAQVPAFNAPLSSSANVDVTIQAFSENETKILKALEAGADSLGELIDLLPMAERDVILNVIQMQKRGLVVAGHGAPGDHVGVPAGPPLGEEDVARILAAAERDEATNQT